MNVPCERNADIAVMKEKQTALEKNQTAFMELIKDLTKKVDNGFIAMNEHITEKFDGLDEKYAKKSSVDRIWWIIWGVITFVFTALGGGVIALLLRG